MSNQTIQYTIDTSSLILLFRKEHPYYRGRFKSLWNDIEESFKSGLLMSHAEVLRELKNNNDKKEELRVWAETNNPFFIQEYSPEAQVILGEISTLSASFFNRVQHSPYADPWLIAQAKLNKRVVITEELLSGLNKSPDNYKIPDICRVLYPEIKCICLRQFIDDMNWTY